MGLSQAFIEQHITAWENWARVRGYPHRVKWPARLFHHAPMENAIRILTSGYLRSREDPENDCPRDVAGAGVIDNRNDAHGFVRIYFRPRTPTQFNIEGIRKPNDCQYGPNAHAPVLIMFLLDARRVLAMPDIRFSERNMQLCGTLICETEQDFAAIPFEKVYHIGGIGGDYSIIEHRAAEVLASSPLSLEDCLLGVCCRSIGERDTLLHLLGPAGDQWAERILISDDLRVFERRYPFVEEVAVGPDGFTIKINPRHDGGLIDLAVKAWDHAGTQIVDFRNEHISPRPPKAERWRIARDLDAGRYRLQIMIEGHLAFEAELMLADTLF